MDDWCDANQPPPATRGRAPTVQNRSRVYTTRTGEEQKVYRAAYQLESKRRRRKMEADAKQQAKADFENQRLHRLECIEPLAGAGPLGAFTAYQLLAFDFVLELANHLSEAQLARTPKSIDATAVSVFAKLLDGRSGAVTGAAFKSVAHARELGEPTISRFVVLRARCQHHEVNVRALLAFAVQQERRKHHANADVAALPSDASLLSVLRASQKKPGRTACGSSTASSCGLSIAENWADGGYTVSCIVKRAEYNTRRVNVSQKVRQRCNPLFSLL